MKINRKITPACWQCRHYKFKPRQPGRIGEAYCKFKDKWFPEGFDFNYKCEGFE